MTAPALHAVVSGWLLGPPSGANRRLIELLRHAATELRGDERVTVLHAPGFAPPALHPRVAWRAAPIPAGPTLRRARAERRVLPGLLRELGATVCDHGMLPAPPAPCPLLLTVHDLRAVDGHDRRPRWLARLVLRRACRRADAIAAPSAFTRERLRALAPEARVELVPNGVALPPEDGVDVVDDGALLHVGHLEPRKNLDVLLRALALLPPVERPALQLVGADAGAGAGLRALARRLGVADRVELCGVEDDAAVQRRYAAARAVVVPSRCEGFGLCALEGLAHSRPVLVAAAGALPEVVGDAGRVLPPDDAAAWARAIGALGAADHDDDARRRRRARAAAFGWPAAAARLVALWRELSAR
ncbi:MAG: glycosyltransferase [Planctomycetota bacterium]